MPGILRKNAFPADRTSALRKWSYHLGLGVVEQVILSSINFLFVIFLAKLVSPGAFGEFNIAWSIVMLLQGVILSMFGTMPGVANKLPLSLWPKLRGAFYLWSILGSGGILLLGLISSFAFPQYSELIVASSFLIFTMQAAQIFRLLCYLDGTRGLAVGGALAFALFLFCSMAVLNGVGQKGGAVGIVCLTVANAACAGFIVFRRQKLRMPDARLMVWTGHQLWRSGRWLIAATLSFWATNMGVIPLAGALFGSEASGALRIVQLLANPLLQFGAVLSSVILPRAAQRLARPTYSAMMRVSQLSIGSFAVISIIYSLGLTFGGTAVVHFVFPGRFDLITTGVFAIASVGASLDFVESALAIPLVARNQTVGFVFARIASLCVFLLILPLTLNLSGLLGLILTGAISNLAQALVVAYFLARMIVRVRLKTEVSIA